MEIRMLITGFFQQVRALNKFLLALYLPILLFLGWLFSLAFLTKSVDIFELVGDVTTVAEVPFYFGALSQIGMLFWAAGATVCCLTLLFLSKLNALEPDVKRFLLLASVFTFVLMFDDMFLFHEEIAEDYLGIDEKLVILGYLILGMAFVYFGQREILAGEYSILALALGLFAVSIFFDAIPDAWYKSVYVLDKFEHMLEDGSKFAGIVTWFVYFARYGYGKFKSLLERKNQELT